MLKNFLTIAFRQLGEASLLLFDQDRRICAGYRDLPADRALIRNESGYERNYVNGRLVGVVLLIERSKRAKRRLRTYPRAPKDTNEKR